MAAVANGSVGPVEQTAAALLDFSKPLEVSLLDATVNAFYGAGSNDEVRGMTGCPQGPSPLHSAMRAPGML